MARTALLELYPGGLNVAPAGHMLSEDTSLLLEEVTNPTGLVEALVRNVVPSPRCETQ
jgi:hypothetical protein